ncbi:GPCR family 2 secretin-like [Trinorchestia longiramus]|nr:GPCR family 2 secretin-like [Trinorchestia longiramus]
MELFLPQSPPRTTLIFCVLVAILTFAFGADLNGRWTEWSKVKSRCTKTCGNGTQEEIRTCTNPSPEGNGKECTTLDGNTSTIEIRTIPCNTEPCWVENTYGNWSECSANCSIGERIRHAMCGDKPCSGVQKKNQTEQCNTWDPATCPDPCIELEPLCTKYSVCVNNSNATHSVAECVCTMGYQMIAKKCVMPPPTPPTPRPIPTLAPAQKIVATAMSKTASTVLIVCVSITLIFFIVLRVFTPDRIIQMNMEIALLAAHCFLLFPSSTTEMELLCRIVSIALHLLFTAVFMFMMLESLHMYSLVGFVVKRNGMLTPVQNVLVGWGVPTLIVLITMCFEYDNYGAEYHCWLQMDKGVNWAQQVPIFALMIIMLSLTEAAGLAEYKTLEGMDSDQLTSAKFSQRTNLILLPFVYIHWLLGTLSEYEQNLALYSLFSIVNAVLGVLVLLLHCSNNQKVRAKMMDCFSKCRGKKTTAKPLKTEMESDMQ